MRHRVRLARVAIGALTGLASAAVAAGAQASISAGTSHVCQVSSHVC